MSGRPHNKDLEDLLKNFKQSNGEELDEFEREALDGFETLDSKEEAFQMKSELDKRAASELFAKKKNEPKIYWFAAAALFIVIGLSVFFILNNQATVEKNVAYVQPASEPQSPDEKLSAVPTEEAETAEPNPAAPKAEKVPVTNVKNDASRRTNINKAEGSSVSSRAILKPAQDRVVADENSVTMDKRDDADKTTVETAKQAAKDIDFETVSTETKKLEQKNEREEISKEQVSDQIAFNDESKARLEESQKNTKKTSAVKNKEKSAVSKAAEADDKSPANIGLAANGSFSNNKSNSVNQPVTSAPAAEQKSSAPGFTQGPARAEEFNSPDNTCYYTGGVTDLIKDVQAKLKDENINKQFDVLLNINEKRKVEKVVFLNVYDLTETERDKVTKILMGLDKFNFYIQPNKKSLFEYKLLYKP